MTTKAQHGEVTRVEIYWDAQDRDNEGWAYRWERVGHGEQSSGLDGVADDDLDGAIAQACWELGVAIAPDQFARVPKVDGGYAMWERDAD